MCSRRAGSLFRPSVHVRTRVTGYVFRYPDPVGLAAITVQAVLFVGIAGIIAFLIENMRKEETQYRTVFEYSQIGIVIFNRQDETILRCNRKFANMLGFTEQELLAMKFPEILYLRGRRGAVPGLMNHEHGDRGFRDPLQNKGWCRLLGKPVVEPIGPKTISCTAVNINARKLAEKTDNNYMIKYRELTENSPVGILIIQNGVIRYSNPAFSRFWVSRQSGFQAKTSARLPKNTTGPPAMIG